ncbi:MAG TPA: Hsp20/alpha crystallin family protein [Chloroflexia bacterium]|nr:Hsp20/alpha crystallin family protein [Chloroflexia bacterium]
MPATKELENGRVEVNAEETKEQSKSNSKLQVGNSEGQEQRQVEQATKQEMATQEGVERTRAGRVFLPAVDIYETADSVVLVADMPGVDENSVDVNLEKNVLTIYGRVEPQYPAGHSLTYSEYRIGDYQRSFTVSNTIDWEKIQGTVKDGVLRLTLPKAGPAKTKKIAITSA